MTSQGFSHIHILNMFQASTNCFCFAQPGILLMAVVLRAVEAGTQRRLPDDNEIVFLREPDSSALWEAKHASGCETALQGPLHRSTCDCTDSS